ncbi:MAG: ribulose-phosphate 3-epimerase [Thermoplasmatota archaeon]
MNNNVYIIPAVIATSQQELHDKINKVKHFVDIIQIDVMDGKFVENNSNDFDFSLPASDCCFEAHLMINDPLSWIEKHGDKVDTILVHVESVSNFSKIIKSIKNKNKRVGFVFNPETSLDVVKDYITDIDEILIMTVNPGFYGSPFLPKALEKVKQLREQYPLLDIEVDGGITDQTIQQAYNAGANMFVSGSFIVKSDNVKQAIERLQAKLK